MKAVRRSRTSLFNDVLRIFLLKKFSRVVVYCSVIKVPVVLSQATALIFYQIRFALSRTFLFFFFLSLPLTSQLNHSTTCIAICQPFFTSFFNFSRSPVVGTICGVFTWYYPTIYPYFTVQISQSLSAHIWGLKNYRKDPVVFVDNIERRKRDLNPRAGFPTYTLSRGASSASWVFLLILNETAVTDRSNLFSSTLIVRNSLY